MANVRFLAIVAAMALLTGCVSDEEAGSPRQTLMRITDAGVGPVDGSITYSQKALKAALPGFEIKTVQATVNGKVGWVLAAFGDGLQVMRFVADDKRRRVAEVQVLSDAIPGPDGARIGMSFRQTRGGAMKCVPGKAEWTGMAVCSRAGGRLRYVYTIPHYEGPVGTLPDRSELTRAVLTRIVWRAP